MVRVVQPSARPLTNRLWLVLAYALLIGIGALPAVVNGYPLLFWDSGLYISGLRGNFPGMPVYYKLLVWVISTPPGGLWLVVLVQSAVTTWILLLTMRAAGMVSVWATACAAAAVMAFTQLPWLASWIMPDLFGGLGILALFLLVFCRDQLARVEAAALLVLLAFSALAATANLLLFAATGTLALVLQRAVADPAPRSSWVWGACLIGAVVVLAVLPNAMLYGKPSINAGGSALFFSRTVDTGIMQPYLRAHCPTLSAPVCAQLPAIEASSPGGQPFLWDGPADALDAWHDPDGSIGRIATAAAFSDLPKLAAFALGDIAGLAARPVLEYHAHGEFVPLDADDEGPRQTIEQRYPDQLAQFLSARQQLGTLRNYFPAPLYLATSLLGYALLLLSLTFSFRAHPRLAMLALATLAFVTLGLVIHGGLVGAYARYHAKLGWVAWPVLAIVAATLFGGGRASAAKEQAP